MPVSSSCSGTMTEIPESPIQTTHKMTLPSRKRLEPHQGHDPNLPDHIAKQQRVNPYSQAYVHLLNSEIQDVAGFPANKEDPYEIAGQPLAASDYGLCRWTAREKQMFFNSVGHRGRFAAAEIARDLGTKEELEVRHYIKMLDDGVRYLREHHSDRCYGETTTSTITAAETKSNNDVTLAPAAAFSSVVADIRSIPAAIEVSAACEQALEAAADAVAVRQACYERNFEKEKWQASWLMTNSLANELNKQALDAIAMIKARIKANKAQATAERAKKRAAGHATKPSKGNSLVVDYEADPNAIKHNVPATEPVEKLAQMADFLFLPRLLQLSSQFFMNGTPGGNVGGVEDVNWRAFGPGAPSIRMTAVDDLYTLAVAATRRLVGASIVAAEARLRLRRRAIYARRMVRVSDTRLARDCVALGGKYAVRDLSTFWRGAPRRLGLHVWDDRKKGANADTAEIMDYDDIEAALPVKQKKDDGDGDDEDDEDDEEEEDDKDDDIGDGDEIGDDDNNNNNNNSNNHNIEAEEEDEDEDSEGDHTSRPRRASSVAMTQRPVIVKQNAKENDEQEQSSEDEDQDESESTDSEAEESVDLGTTSEVGEDEPHLAADINELMTYTALDYPNDDESQHAIRHIIATERKLEKEADQLDMRNSRLQELHLWEKVLKMHAPPELLEDVEDVQDTGCTEVDSECLNPKPRALEKAIDFFAAMKDWRDSTTYQEEWDVDMARVRGLDQRPL